MSLLIKLFCEVMIVLLKFLFLFDYVGKPGK